MVKEKRFIESLRKATKTIVLVQGEVMSVNEGTGVCEVLPEGAEQSIGNIPLRVMALSDTTGVSIVPKVGTQATIKFIGKNRPILDKVQEWTRIMIHDANRFGLTIQANGSVWLGADGCDHPLVQGDVLYDFAVAVKAWLDAHDHGGAAPTAVSPAVPDFKSAKVFTE